MLAKSYDNIKATITVDLNDWHTVSREEELNHTNESFAPSVNHYGTILASIMLPIYHEIGQDNLIKAHQEDPKNGIRKLLHEYMTRRRERETNHE